MNENQCVELMKSSRTEAEWGANCDKVKDSHGGQYQDYWYGAIVLSGVMNQVAAKWGGDDQIRILTRT